jgi:hypothetical protein
MRQRPPTVMPIVYGLTIVGGLAAAYIWYLTR